MEVATATLQFAPEGTGIVLWVLLLVECVSDGNWVFVKPLNPGTHEISFRGNVTSTGDNATAESFSFPSGWNYNTIYELVIE